MAKGTRTLTAQDQMDADHFRQRLQQLIDARGLTAARLAKMAGTTPGTLYRILQGGGEPTRTTLVAIARALGVSIDALAAGTPTATSAEADAYLLFSDRALAMAYPRSIGKLDPEEREAVGSAIADVLLAVEKSPVPPHLVPMVYLPLTRAAVVAFWYFSQSDLYSCAITNSTAHPLSRACAVLNEEEQVGNERAEAG